MNDENVNNTEEIDDNQEVEVTGGLSSEIVSMTKTTLDRILKSKSEYVYQAIAVYTFYCYTATWQNTTKPKSTAAFVMNGLGMGKETFYNAKKLLLDLGLVENVKRKGKNGKVLGYYIKVKYVSLKKSAVNQRVENVVSGLTDSGSTDSGQTDTNTVYSIYKSPNTNNNINILPTTSAEPESPPGNRSDQHIVDTITAFKAVNPMVGRLYSLKHQRAAADTIYKAVGLDEIKKTLRLFSEHKTERFIPVVTTPVQFADNYEKLKIYLAKDNGREAYNPKTLQGKHQTPVIEGKSLNPFYKPQT